MRTLLHALRLLLWLAALASIMAMISIWGPDANMAQGPPKQLERHVTGAILLAFVAAIALTSSGRGTSPPAWWARAVAAAGGVAALGVTFALRAKVRSEGTAHLIEGAGWAWMLAGTAVAAAAGLGSLGLPRPKAHRTISAQRRRKR